VHRQCTDNREKVSGKSGLAGEIHFPYSEKGIIGFRLQTKKGATCSRSLKENQD
jgi:hypothetical protein